MLFGKHNNDGTTSFERVPDLPSDYSCPEWKAYDKACDAAQAAGGEWTPEQNNTYLAYHTAMQARAEQGDYTEDYGDETEEEHSQGSSGKGFWSWLRR
jgi:hypothetical protein